ncbi:hypothetical protein MMC09_006909 [Bachmanniomyces sp. S44760]|nr:hypothetical protein [Bachmanniomyces sp. S44760]
MRSIVILVLSIACVHAELTCLQVGFFSPAAGLLCHFKHKTYNAVENATVNAVTAAGHALKDVAVFDITHHPLVIAYDYGSTAVTNGLGQANSQLKGQALDEVNVGLGFGKEVANMAVSVYEITHWGDLAMCIMSGTYNYSNPSIVPVAGPIVVAEPTSETSRKRAIIPSRADGQAILSKCASDKFKAIANPAVFNITGPNQQVGSTMAQLATFLVPSGVEEEGGKLALNAFDLALPSGEDAVKVYKLGAANEAEYFASEEEALAVANDLKDPASTDIKCPPCGAPVSLITSARRRRARLSRRGSVLSLCCKPTGTLPDLPVDFDVPDSDALAQSSRPEPAAIYDPLQFQYGSRVISETGLTFPPPMYTTWGDAVADKVSILADLNNHDTAVIAWSSDILNLPTSSEEIFGILRGAFSPTDTETRELGTLLQIGEMNGPRRLTTCGDWWSDIPTTNQNLQKLQKFDKAAIDHAKQIGSELTGMDPSELDANIDYYWIPATPAAVKNPDLRGVHTDIGILQLGAADQPGLIIQNGRSLSRVSIVPNGWHVIKGSDWGRSPLLPGAATRHTVFGPEIVNNGRVSMIVNVGPKPVW